jgi:hypothetical protein
MTKRMPKLRRLDEAQKGGVDFGFHIRKHYIDAIARIAKPFREMTRPPQ